MEPLTCSQCGKELPSVIYDFCSNIEYCCLPEEFTDNFESTCSCGRTHIIQVEVKFRIKGDPQ